MGTYNEVCLASGFPVESGDGALAFVLTRPLDHDPANPAGYRGTPFFEWTPVGFSLAGTYDGYGRLDPVTDDALSRHTMSVLREGVADPSRLDEGGIGGLWDALRRGGPRGSLRDADSPSGLRPLTFSLVRSDVFEAMVAGYGEEVDPAPSATRRPYRDAASIEAFLRRRIAGATSPLDVVGLKSSCAPHGDLLDAVGAVEPDALCRALARLVAFDGAMRAAGLTYGPRTSGAQDKRWENVARHHAAMGRVLGSRMTGAPVAAR